jgi:hypothetical protein
LVINFRDFPLSFLVFLKAEAFGRLLNQCSEGKEHIFGGTVLMAVGSRVLDPYGKRGLRQRELGLLVSFFFEFWRSLS